MQIPSVVDRAAATQHGLATFAQLIDSGLDADAIGDLCRAGSLERVHRGVYRCVGSPRSWEQSMLASCLATGSLTAASHRAAAFLWGVNLPGDLPIELTVCRPRGPHPRGALVHRSVDLTPDWITTRRGIPVTKPYRLLADLGAVAPRWQVERTLDVLNAKKLVTIRGARAARQALSKQGRNGVGVLGHLLDQRALGEADSQSVLEARMAALCRDFGLPTPVYQHYVAVNGEFRCIDFAYPPQMVAIEVDGYEFHSAHGVFEDDRIRGNDLLILGWKVLHFTWTQVTTQRDYVVKVLRHALDNFLAG